MVGAGAENRRLVWAARSPRVDCCYITACVRGSVRRVQGVWARGSMPRHLSKHLKPGSGGRLPADSVMDACFSRLPTALPVAWLRNDYRPRLRGGGLRVGRPASVGWSSRQRGSAADSGLTACAGGWRGVCGCNLLHDCWWVRFGSMHAARQHLGRGETPPRPAPD